MSKDLAELVVPAVARWKTALGLSGWDIRYDPAWTSGPDLLGNISIEYESEVAAIRIHPDTPPVAVERIVLHEMLHILFTDVQDAWEEAFNLVGAKPRGKAAKGLMSWLATQQYQRTELSINRLVAALLGVPVVVYAPSDTKAFAPFAVEEAQ